MDQKKVNINSYVLKALHQPCTSTGHVLYVKNDGYTGTMENMTKAEEDAEYQKLSRTTYNSPTNIRRIFITSRRVEVHYYIAPKNNIGLTNIKSTQYKLADITGGKYNNFYDLASAIIGGQAEDTYTFSGNIFNTLSNTYACNNVEEIYVDWLLFLSQDVEQFAGKFSNIFRDIVDTRQFVLDDSKSRLIAKLLLGQFGSKEELGRRFPRLKIAGFISNLDICLQHNELKRPMILELKQEQTWFDANRRLLEASKSLIIPVYLRKSNEVNTQFIVKDAQYKFDKDELKRVVDAYKKRIESIKIKEKYAAIDTSDSGLQAQPVIGEVEAQLLVIEQRCSQEQLEAIIKASTSGLSRHDLISMFSEFSPENRGRMAKMAEFELPDAFVTPVMNKQQSKHQKPVTNYTSKVTISAADIEEAYRISTDTKYTDNKGDAKFYMIAMDKFLTTILPNLAHVIVLGNKVYINPYKFTELKTTKGHAANDFFELRDIFNVTGDDLVFGFTSPGTYNLQLEVPAIIDNGVTGEIQLLEKGTIRLQRIDSDSVEPEQPTVEPVQTSIEPEQTSGETVQPSVEPEQTSVEPVQPSVESVQPIQSTTPDFDLDYTYSEPIFDKPVLNDTFELVGSERDLKLISDANMLHLLGDIVNIVQTTSLDGTVRLGTVSSIRLAEILVSDRKSYINPLKYGGLTDEATGISGSTLKSLEPSFDIVGLGDVNMTYIAHGFIPGHIGQNGSGKYEIFNRGKLYVHRKDGSAGISEDEFLKFCNQLETNRDLRTKVICEDIRYLTGMGIMPVSVGISAFLEKCELTKGVPLNKAHLIELNSKLYPNPAVYFNDVNNTSTSGALKRLSDVFDIKIKNQQSGLDNANVFKYDLVYCDPAVVEVSGNDNLRLISKGKILLNRE